MLRSTGAGLRRGAGSVRAVRSHLFNPAAGQMLKTALPRGRLPRHHTSTFGSRTWPVAGTPPPGAQCAAGVRRTRTRTHPPSQGRGGALRPACLQRSRARPPRRTARADPFGGRRRRGPARGPSRGRRRDGRRARVRHGERDAEEFSDALFFASRLRRSHCRGAPRAPIAERPAREATLDALGAGAFTPFGRAAADPHRSGPRSANAGRRPRSPPCRPLGRSGLQRSSSPV